MQLGFELTNTVVEHRGHRPSPAKLLSASGPAATTLEHRVRELEEKLRRVERERDILKKALAIFGCDE